MTDRELLTTREVAERLGVTQGRIQAMIRGGRLPAQKIGRDWLIAADDLHLVADRKVGNPNWRKKGGEADE